jgi:hypothetical protein
MLEQLKSQNKVAVWKEWSDFLKLRKDVNSKFKKHCDPIDHNQVGSMQRKS